MQWLERHATPVNTVQPNQGAVDVVLIGDSITESWGVGWDGLAFRDAWLNLFTDYKTLNLGISGGSVENMLWRLNHGAIDGLSMKVIVLFVEIHNHPASGNYGAIAEGVRLCVENLRQRCPEAHVVLVKPLPCAKEDVKPLGIQLDAMMFDSDPMVHVLDLWDDFVNRDGSLKVIGFAEDQMHLDDIGYEIYASRLRPILKKVLGRPGSAKSDFACGITLSIHEEHGQPVIAKEDPGTEDNKYGFEGGCVLKLNGIYHLFTAEMVGDPKCNKLKLGHWTSQNRISWSRHETVHESSGETTGKDPRAALWAPMPVYDERAELWNVFYVAYRGSEWKLGGNGQLVCPNHDGRIWRAVSTVKGPEGIHGPWVDVGVILQPGPESDGWEGSQGVDSFYPYKVGDKWLGFYGSSDAMSWFRVGLAEAPSLAGPWKRLTALNPVTLSGPRGSENPVVTRLESGRYVAVFESVFREDGFGYADSLDGVHWSAARELQLHVSPDHLQKTRTPLGLVPEPDGLFTVLYTGFAKADGWGELWLMMVKVEEHDGFRSAHQDEHSKTKPIQRE